jgi:hypothetical protein
MRQLNSARGKFAAGELCELKVTIIHRAKAEFQLIPVPKICTTFLPY